MVISSLIFWVLASICNSIMDKTNHHYSKSIFVKLNPMWWDGEISWKNKYINGDSTLGLRKLFPKSNGLLGKINYPVQLSDAWHFFKTLMIIFLVLSVITFDSSSLTSFTDYLIIFISYGVIWNIIFSLFYNNFLVIVNH
jgi:hypothetical protein